MPANIPKTPYSFPGQPEPLWLNVYDRLLQERLIFLNQTVDSAIANQIIAAMLYLDAEAPDQDIQLYINSSGDSGSDSIVSAMAIYDTMQCLNADVSTVCTGVAAAASAFLLAVGTQGKRLALPHARIMLNQPTRVVTERPAADISIEAKELRHLRQNLNEILAQHTGQPIESISQDTERDAYMSAQEAQAYGLIDHVVSR